MEVGDGAQGMFHRETDSGGEVSPGGQVDGSSAGKVWSLPL